MIEMNNEQVTFRIVPSLRSGKIGCASTIQEKTFFLVIALGLHYLCSA